MEFSRKYQCNRENSKSYKQSFEKLITIINNKMSNNMNTNEFKPSVVGIDLGSMFTKIAALDKGVVEIITNEANLRQTPTIVGYGNNERLIGQQGNVKMKSNYMNTIISPSRYLGHKLSDPNLKQLDFSPCQIKNENNTSLYRVNCQGKQYKLNPEQVTAAFITKIQQIVELNKISNKYMVFSVPNYYTQSEKTALIDAIEISKRSWEGAYGVQLVNQSTAVGLDYGFYKKTEFPESEEDAKNVLFIDFGHSKLSLYVIKFTKNYQKVVYQKHHRHLGCNNLDQQIFKFYSDLFEKNNNNLQIGVRESKRATIKLLENIEKQRKILSGNSQFDFSIECLIEDNDLSYTMKRQQFETIIAPVVQQIQSFLIQAKEKLLEMNIQISNIELLGGGSRIPIFMKTISEVFNKQTSRTLNSSECIARGAALYSAMNCGLYRLHPYYAIDLSSYKVSCSWKGANQQMQNQSNQVTIYEQNQTLFTSKSVEITLNSNKTQLFTLNYCGLSQGLIPQICSFTIAQISQSQQSIERRLKLVFELNQNQTISKLEVYELNKEKQIKLNLDSLQFYVNISKQQIKEYEQIEREQMLNDIKIVKKYESKNKFQSEIYKLKSKVESMGNNTLRQYIHPAKSDELIHYFNDIQNQLDEIANFESKLKEAQLKVNELVNQAQTMRQSHNKVQVQLTKLNQFITNIVSGKTKSIRFYPEEQVNKVLQWVKDIQQQQQKRMKYEPHLTNLAEVDQITKQLVAKIEEYKQKKQQQKPIQSQFYQPPQRNYEARDYEDPFARTNFRNSYNQQNTRGRGKNNLFGYNSGFFSGSPGFY